MSRYRIRKTWILQKRKKIRIQQIFRSKKTQRMQTVKIRS